MSLQHQPFTISKDDIIQIPPLQHSKSIDYEAALQRYQRQKASRHDPTYLEILNAVDLNEWTYRILANHSMDSVSSDSASMQWIVPLFIVSSFFISIQNSKCTQMIR